MGKIKMINTRIDLVIIRRTGVRAGSPFLLSPVSCPATLPRVFFPLDGAGLPILRIMVMTIGE